MRNPLPQAASGTLLVSLLLTLSSLVACTPGSHPSGATRNDGQTRATPAPTAVQGSFSEEYAAAHRALNEHMADAPVPAF